MLNIITRDLWLSVIPTPTKDLLCPIKNVFLMNTHTHPCRQDLYCRALVRRIQQYNVNIQKLTDIRYNFLVGLDGTLYEGRGWNSYPDLPNKYRHLIKSSITVAYLGPYTTVDVPKTMHDTTQQLIHHGITNGFISKAFEFHDITLHSEEPYTIH